MTPINKTITGVAVAALLVVGALALFKNSPELGPKIAEAEVAAPLSGAVASPNRAAANSDALPWEMPGGAVAAASASRSTLASTPVLPGTPVPLTIAQMDQQIALREEQAAALLKQLDLAQAQGTLPPGVNADAARTNLRVALKAQRLGRELIHLTQQPATEERQQRMNLITAEMTALQHELRQDVMVTTTSAGVSR